MTAQDVGSGVLFGERKPATTSVMKSETARRETTELRHTNGMNARGSTLIEDMSLRNALEARMAMAWAERQR